MRVTIRIGGLKHASAETPVRDPADDRDVEAAAKTVVKAAGKTWRTPCTITVMKDEGRKGWVQVRKVTI